MTDPNITRDVTLKTQLATGAINSSIRLEFSGDRNVPKFTLKSGSDVTTVELTDTTYAAFETLLESGRAYQHELKYEADLKKRTAERKAAEKAAAEAPPEVEAPAPKLPYSPIDAK